MSLRKTANPIFVAPVQIPVPGADAVEIQLRFRHKTRSQLLDFRGRTIKARSLEDDLDLLLEIIDGWEGAAVVDDNGSALPFSRQALLDVLEQYAGATLAIIGAYSLAINKAREKN